MQKVSKQSLAMIALSILLAISIALTFTFAVLSATKTAKGSITFEGNYSIVWSGAVGDTTEGVDVSTDSGLGNGIKFSLASELFSITNTAGNKTFSATLKTTDESVKARLAQIKVKFVNASTKDANYTLVFTQTNENKTSAGTITATLNSTKSTGTVTKKTDTTEVTLANLISNLSISDATGETIEFTITASMSEKTQG